jgi:hypothetical protein
MAPDDYVDKPFGIGELMARLRAALRHRLQRHDETPVLCLVDLEIDNVRHRVMRAGEEIKLTRKELDLLSFLARHAGKVVTHRQILIRRLGPGPHGGHSIPARLYPPAAPEDRGTPRRPQHHFHRDRDQLPGSRSPRSILRQELCRWIT